MVKHIFEKIDSVLNTEYTLVYIDYMSKKRYKDLYVLVKLLQILYTAVDMAYARGILSENEYISVRKWLDVEDEQLYTLYSTRNSG